jgi:hypothetical protein
VRDEVPEPRLICFIWCSWGRHVRPSVAAIRTQRAPALHLLHGVLSDMQLPTAVRRTREHHAQQGCHHSSGRSLEMPNIDLPQNTQGLWPTSQACPNTCYICLQSIFLQPDAASGLLSSACRFCALWLGNAAQSWAKLSKRPS